MSHPDLLLAHGYFLEEDPNERPIMRPYPPLGLLYITSHLKRAGFAVEVFDATLATRADWDARVARGLPPVVGIYANLLTRQSVLRMIAQCKAAGARVVMGGPEPANHAENYLLRGADVVVFGEGESTLEQLLPHLARHGMQELDAVPGIAFLDDEGAGDRPPRMVQTAPRTQIPALDDQPFPDRAAIDIPAYLDVWRRHHGKGAVSLITARGCPYRCTWCSHAVFGYTHRRRSPENVVEEVAHIVDTYDPELLWYADDVFTIHHRWLFRYHELLEARGLGRPFETISREDRLNDEVIETLAAMGCYRLWIGAESGSQRILDRMQRRTKAERVVTLVKKLQQHGIAAGMFIMLGFDGEERADLDDTTTFLKDALPDTFLTTVAYPITGTAYHRAVEDQVIELDDDWARGSDRRRTVVGRRTPAFYRAATRWMVNAVELHRLRETGRWKRHPLGTARRAVNVAIGRAGMALTDHQRVTAPVASADAAHPIGAS